MGKSLRKHPFGRLGRDGRITLKCILGRQVVRIGGR
jgi:hypothetical protein